MIFKVQLLLFLMTHLVICMTQSTSVTELDPHKFIVYGPGLEAELALPVRYIFIQVVDDHNNNVTQLNLTEIFQDNNQVVISAQFLLAQTNSLISGLQSEILYIQLGVFVLRFRIHSTHIDQSIRIKLNWVPTNYLIGNRTFLLKAPLLSDNIYCPKYTLSDWLNIKLKCPSTYRQIEEDFSYFTSNSTTKIDPDSEFEKFRSQYSSNYNSVAVCRYKIVQNNIYRKCFGEHTDFRILVEDALITLIRKVRVPYLDFLFNLGDWPLSFNSDDNRDQFMIISWSGSLGSRDIVIPSYEMMEWVLGMMKSISLDVFTVLEAASHLLWESRSNIAFWRGRDSSHERLKLVRMSHNDESGLLDARLTAMFFFPNNSVAEVGILSEHVSFLNFFRSKFLVHLDGTVAAYRLPLSLAGGSLILKQRSQYYEYFYSPHNPEISSDQLWWSISNDISDLNTTLQQALSHDKEAYLTGQRAVKFVHENLMPHNVWCYYGRVWEKLGALTVQENPSLEELKTDGFELVFDVSKYESHKEICNYDKSDTRDRHDRSDL